MPYLDSRQESKNYVDSLTTNGIDTILIYHKKHGFREYYILWLDSVLQIRKVTSTGIFKLADWNFNGLYRNKKIFDFYLKYKNTIDTAQLMEEQFRVVGADTFVISLSHYPYTEIIITIGKETKLFHLPYGIISTLDNSPYHFARLIESIIYNLEKRTYWIEAEKKLRYFPKNYNPEKEKWQNWEREKIRTGEIWDDYYH